MFSDWWEVFHFWRTVAVEAFWKSLSFVGQTTGGVVFSLLVVLVFIAVLLFRHGWGGMKEKIWEKVLEGVSITVIAFVFVFLWMLAGMPSEIREEANGQPRPSFRHPDLVVPPFWSHKMSRPLPARDPNTIGGSFVSKGEPSERAVLRMMGIKATIKAGGFEATISVQNVGKYIALPMSVVRTAVKESPPLSLVDVDKLFDGAPNLRKKPNKPNNIDAPNWQRGSIISFLPWYPGDNKSVTVHGLPDDPREIRSLGSSPDEGWYVLTRAFFFDKLGMMPYRDSCTFFSVKVPDGASCLKHND